MKKEKLAWAAVCLVYLLFIFAFSYLYPYGMDEYANTGFSVAETWGRAWQTFWTHSPKTGVFLASFILYFGKWLFLLLNPFVQLGLVLGIFYFVYLRLPDFKSFADMPVFILTAVLSVFAVPVPANTLFWIGGATAYSWTFGLFLFFLCALRASYEGRPFFKDGAAAATLLFFPALFLGLSNENNAPAALCLFAFYAALNLWRKKKLPRWFYFAFAGVLAGVCIMFLSPALLIRLEETALGFETVSISQRLFFHIYHFNVFVKANLLVFAADFLILLICCIDFDRKAFRDKNWLYALFCFSLAFELFFVLFAAPSVGGRNYYSAAVLSVITLLFALEYLKTSYGLKPARLLALAAFIYVFVILPLFAVPYISLYKQSVARGRLLKAALEKGHSSAALPFYISVSPGISNYEILFYDAVYNSPAQRRQHFKIDITPVRAVPGQIELPTNSVII